jgi:hypothetical protein
MSAPAGNPPAAFSNGPEAPAAVRSTVITGGTVEVVWASYISDVSTTSAAFTYPSVESVERRAVAEHFGRIARNIRGVVEVWLDSTLPDLEVSVVMRELDFDSELELRGIFIDLVCERFDPSVGELSIYTEDEEVPDFVREGQLLA